VKKKLNEAHAAKIARSHKFRTLIKFEKFYDAAAAKTERNARKWS